MRNLNPQRRRAAALAGSGGAIAGSAILLGQQFHGRTHDFVFGICTGLAIPLLAASIILLRRESACRRSAI